MSTKQLSQMVQQLRRALLLHDGAGLTDGQLLGCFVEHRDEAAFATLVKRHGPMVWGVCRRLLRNHHDAEDAFQATFLVLVRKAASIVPREMVGNWLYGVAHQTGLKARAVAAKRHERETQVTEMPEPAVVEEDLWNDLQPLLDQELSRLPDAYREVIVLTDLEGKTRKEVARQLGLPEGTVGSRLARARTMLAKRLTQRGAVLSAGALAVVLSQSAGPACVPPSVVSSTIKAASLLAVGQAATAGMISVKVAALTEGVLKSMLLTKLKTLISVFLVLGTVACGGGLVKYQIAAAQQGSAAETDIRQPKTEQGVREAKTDVPQPEKGDVDVKGRLVKDPKTDQWEVELEIPQEDLGRVLSAFDASNNKTELNVIMMLKHLPIRTYLGKLAVDKIQGKTIGTGSKVPAWVRLYGSDIPKESQLTPEAGVGAEVLAHIRCRPQPDRKRIPQKLTDEEGTVPQSEEKRQLPGASELRQIRAEVERLRTDNEELKKRLQQQVRKGKASDVKLVTKIYPVEGLTDPDEFYAQSLMRVIARTIEPTSWYDMGGEGSMEYLWAVHSLIIRQSPDIQKQVGDLLDALRKTKMEHQKAQHEKIWM